MSFVQPEALQVIADSVGISKLSADAAKVLAPDVEYRLREIIQARSLDVHNILVLPSYLHLRLMIASSVYCENTTSVIACNLCRLQEAVKFKRHSKRTALTTDDISHALRLRNVQACLICART